MFTNDPVLVSSEARRVASTMPTPGTTEFRESVATLGHHFAHLGALAVERQLDALARLAQHHHVETVAAAVLADRRQPEVARARAFSRVVSALCALTPDAGQDLAMTA